MRRDRSQPAAVAPALAALLVPAGPRTAADYVPVANAPLWSRVSLMIVAVTALLVLATAEIWLFGLGDDWLLGQPGDGALHGTGRVTGLLDYVYLSAVIHRTLGLGDLVPSGSIRFLVGTQALVGLTLISWSAAFTFLGMDRCWRDSTERRHRAAYGTGHDRGAGG